MSGGVGGEAIGRGLIFLSGFRVGRILLWIVISLLVLLALPQGGEDRKVMLLVAFVIALFPLVGAYKEAQRNRPLFSKWFLFKLAVGAVLAGGAMLALWLMNRRGGAAVAPPPPLPEEVDRLAYSEPSEERAA